MIQISIIVPVYNVQDYLNRALDSLYRQNDADRHEIILVNDGSTDNSFEICNDYKRDYPEWILVNKENGGLSDARNIGTEIARGIYLCFIDADDCVSSHYIEDLVKDMVLEKDIDLVIQGYYQIYPDNKSIDFIPEPHISYLAKDSQLFYSINRYFAPFSKLFRYDIVKKHYLHFDTNLIVAEDYDFLLRYLLHAQKLHVSNKANYYYSNDGSLSSRIYSFEQEYNVYHNTYYLSAEFSHRASKRF